MAVRRAIELMPQGVVVVDDSFTVRAWNSKMNKLFDTFDTFDTDTLGRQLETLFPSGFVEVITPAVLDAIEFQLTSALSPFTASLGGVNHEVQICPFEGRTCVVQFEELSLLQSLESQINEQADEIRRMRRELSQRERDVAYAAYVDPVTGLANRRLFNEHLRRALARSKHGKHLGALVLFDLDQFKVVNESFGLGAGDELLREVGERLMAAVRDVDTVARRGGDEFLVILDGIERAEDALLAAVRLAQSLADPFTFGGTDIYLTASAGVTVYPLDGEDAETLLKNADAAMYWAKDRGRNNVQLYSGHLSRSATERLSMASALHRAVEEEAFELHYQPQLDLGELGVAGVEALLRWNDAERGPVSPGVFVPVLEDTGLIGRVGAWVLKRACLHAAGWQKSGLGMLQVAVNVSARQFHTGELVPAVQIALEQSGLEPRLLEIEITEGLLMEALDSSIKVLQELKNIGVRVAIDDFGTGYSSLSYLKRFPVDTLKIDRAFVRDLTEDLDDQAICRAIVKLGHELGLEVVAEGVETDQQLELLKGYHCDYVQGFLLGRPMPLRALVTWLRDRMNGNR